MPQHPVQLVRRAVYDALKAEIGITDPRKLQVIYGLPTEDSAKRFVCVANTRFKSAPATLGRSVPISGGGNSYAKNSSVEVDVAIQVRSSLDPLEVDESTWSLASQVEDAIRRDPALGGTCWNACITDGDQSLGFETQNHITTLVLTVTAQVRS